MLEEGSDSTLALPARSSRCQPKLLHISVVGIDDLQGEGKGNRETQVLNSPGT